MEEQNTSPVRREMDDLGIVTDKLRRGVVLGFLAVSISFNTAQWIRQNNTNDRMQTQSEKFQEVMMKIIEQKRETEKAVDSVIFKK